MQSPLRVDSHLRTSDIASHDFAHKCSIYPAHYPLAWHVRYNSRRLTSIDVTQSLPNLTLSRHDPTISYIFVQTTVTGATVCLSAYSLRAFAYRTLKTTSGCARSIKTSLFWEVNRDGLIFLLNLMSARYLRFNTIVAIIDALSAIDSARPAAQSRDKSTHLSCKARPSVFCMPSYLERALSSP